MMRLWLILAIVVMTLTAPVWADSFCAEEGTCGSCAESTLGDGRCFDRTESRGPDNLPSNSEREINGQLVTLLPLPDTTAVAPPAEAPRTVFKQVIDSSRGQKFGYGHSELTPQLQQELRALAAKLADQKQISIDIVGHTDPDRLTVAAAARYRDNYGLGLARAEATANFLKQLLPTSTFFRIGSAGPDQPLVSNATSEGRARNRRVELIISYALETPAETLPALSPVAVEPLRSCQEVLASSYAANAAPFRISVDGVPLDSAGTTDPDLQRCTDLGLAQADIQLRYDAGSSSRRLNIVAVTNPAQRNRPLIFRGYSNYRQWFGKAEVRLFVAGVASTATPLAIVPLDSHLRGSWQADAESPSQLTYLLRVYDAEGHFDETALKPLRLDNRVEPPATAAQAEREELIGYGENSLRLRNIPVFGGMVTMNGEHIPAGSQIKVMGLSVPLAANGRFAAEQILPAGEQLVTVQVDTTAGTLDFSRHLEIPKHDWFYVGIADLVAGRNSTSGPAALVTADSQHYDNDLYADGRLAFYLKGKLNPRWTLTASADTQDQPLKSLFSNFDEKDPYYYIRRLDPDLYYPSYGDDSTTVEDAPTRGKFFVKVNSDNAFAMWGSYQTRWSESELVNFNRSMYGAEVNWHSRDQTSFGQKKSKIDLFAGDPGTLDARNDLRGTGGSLYYLSHMDITAGSEKVWVEVRDDDSGLVLETNQLTAGEDYEINSIQGRVLLSSPLPSTADDSDLVRASSLAGNPVYLVVTYEYSPALDDVDNMTMGGRWSQWLGDSFQFGLTGYKQGSDATEQTLAGADMTWRYSAGTYLRGEFAQSDGAGSGYSSSRTGGYDYTSTSGEDVNALAARVEGAVDLAAISSHKGKAEGYWQQRQAGYSAPGEWTTEDIDQAGIKVEAPLTEDLTMTAKADIKDAESSNTLVANVRGDYKLDEHWRVSSGIRVDDYDTVSGSSSNDTGSRGDLALEVGYRPGSDEDDGDWSIYGFGQGTVLRDGDRKRNDRFGLGGDYKVVDPLRLNGELSGGSGGLGAKLGGDWRVSERSQLYLSYTLSSDRTDNGYRGRQGKLTSGGRTRYSDSLAVYAEESYEHGEEAGLIHSFGLDLAPLDRWNFGVKAEQGRLTSDDSSDIDRIALSLSAGYAAGKNKYAGNVEWRQDQNTSSGDRITWLMRNSVGYQISPDWRLIGKLNGAISYTDAGDEYDAEYIEASLGYAFRPVLYERFNMLFKYTYLFDLPSSGDVGSGSDSSDYAQRSHVLAVDAIYDLLPWLSVGGKYGFRHSEISDRSGDGDSQWYQSDAHLVVARGDIHILKSWDALVEGRWLKVMAAEDAKAGMLLGLYRHLNKNFKFGGGYNFTDFSDDLTDLDYRSRGWFINLVGQM